MSNFTLLGKNGIRGSILGLIATLALVFSTNTQVAKAGPPAYYCLPDYYAQYGYAIWLYGVYPNSTYTRGQTINLYWSYGYYYPWYYMGHTLTIECSNDGGKTWTVVKDRIDPYNTGSYNWTIPKNFPYGTGFQFRAYEQVLYDYNCAYNFQTPWPYGQASINNITILKGCFPPTITKQPQSADICIGGSTTLSVATDLDKGAGEYQWRRDTKVIATTSEPTLTLNNLTAADAATYDVVVRDLCSQTAVTTSAGATLNILAPPSIKEQPVASMSLCQFSAATIKVVGAGAGLRYQWNKDGTPIQGATSPEYVIANAGTATVGSYTCTISGTCSPSVTSTPCVISVILRPVITSNPTHMTLCPGNNTQLTVGASGAQLSYQWFKDDAIIPGATTATYSLSNYNNTMNGKYHASVTSNVPNPAGCSVTLYTVPAQLSSFEGPTVSKQPAPALEVCVGKPIVLVAEFGGSNLTYKWMKNGVQVPNANSNELNIPVAKASDAGTYRVMATSTCNLSFSSGESAVTIVTPPIFTAQPAPADLQVGQRLELSVAAAPASSYQWYKDGQAITGATSATYTVDNVTKANAGYYRVTVGNACTPVSSGNARVTVLDAQAAEPRLTMSASTYDLGEIPVGYSKTVDITDLISNSGTAPLSVSNISVPAGTADFIVEGPGATMLQPGEKASVTVRGEGLMLGAKNATLTVATNAVPANGSVTLTSTVVLRYETPSAFTFEDTREDATSEKCFSIKNNSAMNVSIDLADVGGLDAAAFSIITPRPLNIPANGTTDMCVRFVPGSVGAKSATVLFTSPTGGNSSMTLAGNGTVAVGIHDEALAKTVSAYPNPVRDEVVISAASGSTITIVSAEGATVANLQVAEGSTDVRWNTKTVAGGIATGAYTVIVKNNGATAHIPLVVVR